jgi:hypothetical protein
MRNLSYRKKMISIKIILNIIYVYERHKNGFPVDYRYRYTASRNGVRSQPCYCKISALRWSVGSLSCSGRSRFVVHRSLRSELRLYVCNTSRSSLTNNLQCRWSSRTNAAAREHWTPVPMTCATRSLCQGRSRGRTLRPFAGRGWRHSPCRARCYHAGLGQRHGESSRSAPRGRRLRERRRGGRY